MGAELITQPRDTQNQLLDLEGLAKVVRRLAHEIIEKHAPESLLIAGIEKGGIAPATMLVEAIAQLSGVKPAMTRLDISNFRDDLPREQRLEAAAKLNLQDEIANKTVVVVDDVVQTGRTFRAALDLLMSLGRPASVEALALFDRGARELPIRPTYVGKNVPVSPSHWIEVKLSGPPAQCGAYLVERP